MSQKTTTTDPGLHDSGLSPSDRTDHAASSGTIVALPSSAGATRRRIHLMVDDALSSFLNTLQRGIDRGDFTAADVSDGLAGYPDFENAWAEREEDDCG